ncbi:MAG: hypothetical protein GC172_00120 [Phycisphaera sp.]|nr:hypothetical protein [Phycisphaera sp.]
MLDQNHSGTPHSDGISPNAQPASQPSAFQGFIAEPVPATDIAQSAAAAARPFDMGKSFDGARQVVAARPTAQQRSAPPSTVPAPLSVPAPRSAAMTPNNAAQPQAPAQTPASIAQQTRLTELLARVEAQTTRLEAKLADEHEAADRAVRLAAELEERLKLGVRMLQAFDVQGGRGERIAERAVGVIDDAERVLAAAREQSERAARSTHEQAEKVTDAMRAALERAAHAASDAAVQAADALRNKASLAAAECKREVEEAAASAQARTEAAIREAADRVVGEKVALIARELDWRFDRIKEIEARLEHAANATLAAVDAELGGRLERIDDMVRRAETATARVDAALSATGEAAALIERSERATAALAGLSSDGQRLIDALAIRVGDGTALREVLGKLVHELAAARESVHGDMRRMRDDLSWLVERGERMSGELVERADRANVASESVRAATESAAPVLEQFAHWAPLLASPSPERIRPIADAIAGGVRAELSQEMRSLANALRHFAGKADRAFAEIALDTDLLQGDSRTVARNFAGELSRLGPIAAVEIDTLGAPVPHAHAENAAHERAKAAESPTVLPHAIPTVTVVANTAVTVDPPVLTGSWRLPPRR